jgi:hypothetical protein
MVSELIVGINLFCCLIFFFLCVILSIRRTRRREQDGQPVEGHLVSTEGNDNVGVDAVPETGREHKRCGRPRKNKDVLGIDEVVKQLLSDFEFTDGKKEDLFYDSDEVQKEREGTAHWWDSVEFNVNEEGAVFGDRQADDVNESDGLASLEDNDSDGVKERSIGNLMRNTT